MDKAIHSAAQVTLSRLLREHRVDAGLRQVDVADRLEKPQSFVSKYESGERRIDFIELNQICDALGIDVIELVQVLKAQADGT
ncbi:MAG TPA: helix-turn-helix transcriptional regulator [Mycobacteriales bacterium]|jgi:transcriptional regulator with XRE-family HTH domain|nr:helix-turn-helix transcriptional regulator [Mycobacteriales bacterium]